MIYFNAILTLINIGILIEALRRLNEIRDVQHDLFKELDGLDTKITIVKNSQLDYIVKCGATNVNFKANDLTNRQY